MLDSTPLSLLKENVSVLPNIGALFRNGIHFETQSSANLVSAGVWQTFASGLMPGEQGHYFPMQWEPSGMRFIPVEQDTLRFEPFWDRFARDGVKTVVFDAMGVPLNPVAQGVQVINWNTQCNFAASSNRPDVLKHIKTHFGHKPIGDEIAVKKSRRALGKLRDQLVTSIKAKTEAMLWLMREFDWNCFVTGIFEGTARPTICGRSGKISAPIRRRERCSTYIARSTSRSDACSPPSTFPRQRSFCFLCTE